MALDTVLTAHAGQARGVAPSHIELADHGIATETLETEPDPFVAATSVQPQ